MAGQGAGGGGRTASIRLIDAARTGGGGTGGGIGAG